MSAELSLINLQKEYPDCPRIIVRQTKKRATMRLPNRMIDNIPLHPDQIQFAAEQLRDGTIILHPEQRPTPWALGIENQTNNHNEKRNPFEKNEAAVMQLP